MYAIGTNPRCQGGDSAHLGLDTGDPPQQEYLQPDASPKILCKRNHTLDHFIEYNIPMRAIDVAKEFHVAGIERRKNYIGPH
jgi:hypothetical protein